MHGFTRRIELRRTALVFCRWFENIARRAGVVASRLRQFLVNTSLIDWGSDGGGGSGHDLHDDRVFLDTAGGRIRIRRDLRRGAAGQGIVETDRLCRLAEGQGDAVGGVA